MTTCLLCPSEAVADGLCVADGARLWAANEWSADVDFARDTRDIVLAARFVPPEHVHRARAIAEDINTPDKAVAFLSRLDAARAERKRAEDERIRRRDGET